MCGSWIHPKRITNNLLLFFCKIINFRPFCRLRFCKNSSFMFYIQICQKGIKEVFVAFLSRWIHEKFKKKDSRKFKDCGIFIAYIVLMQYSSQDYFVRITWVQFKWTQLYTPLPLILRRILLKPCQDTGIFVMIRGAPDARILTKISEILSI